MSSPPPLFSVVCTNLSGPLLALGLALPPAPAPPGRAPAPLTLFLREDVSARVKSYGEASPVAFAGLFCTFNDHAPRPPLQAGGSVREASKPFPGIRPAFAPLPRQKPRPSRSRHQRSPRQGPQ